MKGLELSRRFYESIGKQMIDDVFPSYAGRVACGLVGEGSECFGFDDELSQDHDFGAAFCMWLTDGDYDEIGQPLNDSYMSLPDSFLGFPRRDLNAYDEQRVGAMRISDFYLKFTGCPAAPQTIAEWRMIPESFLAVATNGEVFRDDLDAFSEVRSALLAFYPEDIRLKKLAARVATMAQSGQYNFKRCMDRRETVAASLALSEFIKSACSAVFLLNKKYMPFYKWAHRGLKALPLVSEAWALSEAIVSGGTADSAKTLDNIEALSDAVLRELKAQNLTYGDDDFLLPHADVIMQHITDPVIAGLHIFAE